MEAPYEAAEEFEVAPRAEVQPIKPNYNLKLVLRRLPKLYEEENYARCKQLLLGLHERLWHSSISDFIRLAEEAAKSCAVCRKYVRLPNRPQMVQMDFFNWENTWYMLVLDEATRFKSCCTIEGQHADQLLTALLHCWIYTFGAPGKVIMDQQVSLMGREAGSEFERLNMQRDPKGTTAGPGAEQHTGTGLVERHVQLMKMTMYKLRAELQRQGMNPQPEELGRESAMAQNITHSYKDITPAVAVFGTLPRGFYDTESEGILSYAGQTDISVFERALRIRQTALVQAQQALIEDTVARASRTRPHQLDLSALTAGTLEVEFCREVKDDPGGEDRHCCSDWMWMRVLQ